MKNPIVPIRSRFLYQEIEIWNRRGLPHWQCPGGVYSLTLHCEGSLPQQLLASISKERTRKLRSVRAGDTPSRRELAEIDGQFMLDIDRELDRSRGPCPMYDAEVATMVENALHYFDGERYNLLSWSVMPNHLHSVFRLFDDQHLAELIHSWKSFTTNRARALGAVDRWLWQEGYFDRLVRDTTDLGNTIAYVVDNPRKAGLKNWTWAGRNDNAIREILRW